MIWILGLCSSTNKKIQLYSWIFFIRKRSESPWYVLCSWILSIICYFSGLLKKYKLTEFSRLIGLLNGFVVGADVLLYVSENKTWRLFNVNPGLKNSKSKWVVIVIVVVLLGSWVLLLGHGSCAKAHDLKYNTMKLYNTCATSTSFKDAVDRNHRCLGGSLPSHYHRT